MGVEYAAFKKELGTGHLQLWKEVRKAEEAKRDEVRTLLVECLAEAMQSRGKMEELLKLPFDTSEEEKVCATYLICFSFTMCSVG